MEALESIVMAQDFFAGLDLELGKFIASCTRNCHFEPGAYLFHEGELAREFYIVRHGKVALEIASPGRKTLVLSTMQDGDIVGASCLVAPHRWNADARAQTHVRALGFGVESLRAKCEEDPSIGYQLLKRFAALLAGRLLAAHLQLLDMYGRPEKVLAFAWR
jgi:CRP-like cAMP-binding protein